MLSRGVDLDIFVQLYAVWLVLIPGFGLLKYLRRIGGLIQALFMLNIAPRRCPNHQGFGFCAGKRLNFELNCTICPPQWPLIDRE